MLNDYATIRPLSSHPAIGTVDLIKKKQKTIWKEAIIPFSLHVFAVNCHRLVGNELITAEVMEETVMVSMGLGYGVDEIQGFAAKYQDGSHKGLMHRRLLSNWIRSTVTIQYQKGLSDKAFFFCFLF